MKAVVIPGIVKVWASPRTRTANCVSSPYDSGVLFGESRTTTHFGQNPYFAFPNTLPWS